MTHTRVVNLRVEPFDVYIGRGSEWGNPFSHRPDTQATEIVATREEAIARYRVHLWARLRADPELVNRLANLRGLRLGCYCAPAACHGDVLVIASEWAARENERQVLAELRLLLGAKPIEQSGSQADSRQTLVVSA